MASCDRRGAGDLRVAVTVPGRDTLRYETRAVARPCAAARGIVLEGLEAGNGALVWLLPGDSAVAGEYVLRAAGDTAPGRRFTAGFRYVRGGAAHGVTLDSGAVVVREARRRLSVQVRGSGLEMPTAVRGSIDAELTAVRVAADSVACEAQGS